MWSINSFEKSLDFTHQVLDREKGSGNMEMQESGVGNWVTVSKQGRGKALKRLVLSWHNKYSWLHDIGTLV